MHQISQNCHIAQDYYKAMANKDLTSLAKYIKQEAHFTSPFSELKGKEAYLAAAEGFMSSFDSLSVRQILGDQNQVVVIYDVVFPAPVGKIATAALLDIQEDQIIKAELFFDAHPLKG